MRMRDRVAVENQETHQSSVPTRTLIGGVGYWWHGDGSTGLIASEELAQFDWPPGIEVSDLGYGAIFIMHDLSDAQPPYDRLVLLAAVERGREPGEIYRYRWQRQNPPDEEIQRRIFEAGAGVIDVDHLLVISEYFNALPDETLVIEVEPIDLSCGDCLSPGMKAVLPRIIDQARSEALKASEVSDSIESVWTSPRG